MDSAVDAKCLAKTKYYIFSSCHEAYVSKVVPLYILSKSLHKYN